MRLLGSSPANLKVDTISVRLHQIGSLVHDLGKLWCGIDPGFKYGRQWAYQGFTK